MPTWAEYKHIAKERGAQAYEVYVAQTIRVEPPPDADFAATQQAHLARMRKLEEDGILMFAGPLSDGSGEHMSGNGMIVLRAPSLGAARDVLAADPMHTSGIRTFTVCKWLINEGTVTVRVGLSSGDAALV